ncbi:NUDIX domain-containing protein [Paenibacillus sp. JX-17]|uniref:NUDIX domain-containing protein n=1 Tax=Paenibacillus lacisoli TaxID=3064525 RepID=A0ABT9CJ36_9BACL|nr:NUDIX domain-containing protein [Paenibacillus sp. JX-17]MDO7908634.1 NUDIX domain-containing protein [Paenibacillus sp. JX-17]
MTQPTFILVASVSVMQDQQVLIIQENKPGAEGKWNFPSGRLEQGEDIVKAARREAREETGLEVEITATTGVYNFISDTGQQVILFHFLGNVTGGMLDLAEEEIVDSRWIHRDDLQQLQDKELRNPGVIRQIAGRLTDDTRYPLEIFNTQLI